MKKLWFLILLLMFPTLAYCSGGNLTNGTTVYFTDDGENLTAKVNDTLVNKWNGYEANLSNDNLTDNNTDQLPQGSTNKYANTTAESQGNQSFGWGNHASAGYALQSNLSVKLDASRGNWKVFYSNDTGVFTELPLGASGTYLKANGVSAAPSWDTPTGSGTGVSNYSSFTANETSDINWGHTFNATGLKVNNVPVGFGNANMSDVVALSNLSNYYTITQSNSTYFNYTSGVPWGNITSVPANTTSNQATNTTSDVVFVNVNATAFKGSAGNLTNLNATNIAQGTLAVARLPANSSFDQSVNTTSDVTFRNVTANVQSVVKGFTVYNITANHDFPLFQANKNLTLKKVTTVCIGGTNVVGQFEVANVTGLSPVKVNATDWTTTPTGSLSITAFGNATVSNTSFLTWNTTSVSGTPTTFTVSFEYSESN